MIRFNNEFPGTGSKPSNSLRTHPYLNTWFGKHALKKNLSQVIETNRWLKSSFKPIFPY